MKRIITLVIGLVLCVSLCACAPSAGSKNYTTTSGLIEITGQNNLYYDSNTKIVYFIFNEYSGYVGYGYMSPYYAPNDLPYRYDANNQTLIEIDGGGING